MNLKKQVCNLDNRRAYAGNTTSAQEYHIIDFIDSALNIFVIGGYNWIIK